MRGSSSATPRQTFYSQLPGPGLRAGAIYKPEKTKNTMKPKPEMKSYTPTTAFTTPPENRGQILSISYAVAAGDEAIIERLYDRSDRSLEYRAYAYPENDDGEWEPWNGAPELGEYLGQCEIAESDEGI